MRKVRLRIFILAKKLQLWPLSDLKQRAISKFRVSNKRWKGNFGSQNRKGKGKIAQQRQKLSVQFSCSVLSNSLQLNVLQQARLPYPSATPQACSNSCPSSQWCHSTISSSVIPFSSCLQSFPASVFSSESVLHIRWPKYWCFSFSISLSNGQTHTWLKAQSGTW